MISLRCTLTKAGTQDHSKDLPGRVAVDNVSPVEEIAASPRLTTCADICCWGFWLLSPTSPGQSQAQEYLTKCNLNNILGPSCGWTLESHARTATSEAQFHHAQENVPLNPFGHRRLKSGLLNVSGDVCVEFWFHKPGQTTADLRMLVQDVSAERQLWTLHGSVPSSWQQVFVSLSYSEDTTIQIIFEAAQERSEDENIAIDNIGVRKGLCGEQCTPGSGFWTGDACTTQCTCFNLGLICSPASCPEQHTCETSNGLLGCYPSSDTCIVRANSHCSTFDGAELHLIRTCTYNLATVCRNSSDIPYFRVEAQYEKGENGLTSSTSSIQQIHVDLQNLRVSMLQRQKHKVIVNGLWRSLPLSLNEDQVIIQLTGDTVILKTDFQLNVLFNMNDEVNVTVPTLYSAEVCGLCEKFSQWMDTDLMQYNGSQRTDRNTFERSWQKEAIKCETPFPPELCTRQERAKYGSVPGCGTLLLKEGPFSKCSNVINTDYFFRWCVLDMCGTQGNQNVLCGVLQAYAEACKRAGVEIPAWRNASACPMVCPSNSHYIACASSCPATCSARDTPKGCGSCEEQCRCDPGFLLSGGLCVSAEDCGCWRNNQHYKKGKIFMDEDCHSQCQCMGQDEIQCAPASCANSEVCKIKKGVRGCYPSSVATCQVFGDPHFITFDGKLFDFQGKCNYTLVKTLGNSTVPFVLTVRNENRGNPAWSALNSIALSMRGLHVAIRTGRKVYVNGHLAQLPAQPNAEVEVFLKKPYVQVETIFGMRLLFDGKHRLFVQVDERHQAEVHGLCGTYSNNQFDDFITPDGMLLVNPEDFANSWKTEDHEWECVVNPPPLQECNPQLENAGYEECSILFGDPFKPCHWFVPPQLHVNSCVYDYCATLGDIQQLCISLESYVATCQLSEVYLEEWQEGTICVMPSFINYSRNQHCLLMPFPLASPLDCNFDNGECGWEQLLTDSFDWFRHRGPTPSDLTGPSHDHTTGDGHYMYIEGDRPHYGDSARMLSPACYATGPACLRFWYHMYGTANAMALNLYQLQGNVVIKIWSKTNNHGDLWHPAHAEFNISGKFQIIVEGIRGSTHQSDISLDDISLQQGTCSGSSSTVVETTTPLATSGPVCSFQCSFEKDICSWNQLHTDSFDWTRQRGSTPTSMTGPSSDHTTGDGHYLYIEASSVHNGDAARLLSPQCSVPGPHCLHFWYHMYGSASNMGLRVNLLEKQTAQTLWSAQNNQGNVWHKVQVELETSGTFQIIFEGRRGTDEHSDVAVDDVNLQHGKCPEVHA
ncbi:IgGFc-binding protein-like isoform X1 [Arapaima gigas]